jgi:hypothetical protein
MVKPSRVLFQSLVGACVGMTAGVIVVGVWGGLSGIPFILSHAGPKNDPVMMFLSGVVVYALYVGLPLGAPVGAFIGLILGAIRGSWSGSSTVRKTTVPVNDLAAQVIAEVFAGERSPSSRRSRWSGLVVALAIPGAVILVWSIYGWWERSRFDRFVAEVKRLGGHADNAEIEGWSIAVNSIDLDLSSTATNDADLERLARDPMFGRVYTLSLAGTRITDRGIVVLNQHPFFSHLDLSRTSVTDLGLASIAQCCPNSLNLSGTRVTDATVRLIEQQAERFPNRNIDLTDTQVTEERVRELGKSHWMMLVTYGSSKSPKSTR